MGCTVTRDGVLGKEGRFLRWAGVIAVLYLALHLWSLSWYPFVHSDEAWLASLSRTMWSGGATEEFFRLTPRHPHALKTLFHLLQGPLVTRWWAAPAARLPSLIAGIGVVGTVAALLLRLGVRRWVVLAVTVALALDPQLFSISHLGRQEALITVVMVAAVLLLVRTGSVAAAATVIGVSIFIHPNAFIAACGVFPWVPSRERPLRRVLVFTAVLAGWALLAVAASYALDGDFLRNYLAFGESVGVTAGPLQRLALFREYFYKLATGVAGTYYLPPVALQFAVLALVVPLGLLGAGGGAGRRGALSVLAVAAGIFMVGKYSPPGVVFLFPWIYVTAALVAENRVPPGRVASVPVVVLVSALAVISAVQLGVELARWYPHRYERYIAPIREVIPPGEIALTNLNSAFAFGPGEIRVWRDLGGLPPVDDAPPELLQRPLAMFLHNERVQWVVLPADELVLIYRERPVWNDVYGNPHRFYPDLLEILQDHAELVTRFEAPIYGMRLVPFMQRGPHYVEIYRLQW